MNVSIFRRVESGLNAHDSPLISFAGETFEHKGNQKKRSYAHIEETRAQKLVTVPETLRRARETLERKKKKRMEKRTRAHAIECPFRNG